MKAWPWIVVGAALCLVNPILGALVMWPGFVIWIAKRLQDKRADI